MSKVSGNAGAVQRMAAPAAPMASRTVQPWFQIRGGKKYDINQNLPNDARRKVLFHADLNGLDPDLVVTALEQMKDDGAQQGTKALGWPEVIGMAITRASAPVASTAMDVEDYFAPFTPMYDDISAPPSPTNNDYFTFARRNSGEFSDQFKATYSESTSDFRGHKYRLEHNDSAAAASMNNIPSGFVSLTGKKNGLWDGTVYKDMFPRTQTVLGIDDNKLAQLVLDGLLDDAAFKTTLSTMSTDQQTATHQLVLLFHNEILKRGSNNLIAIAASAYRTISEGDNNFTNRLESRGLFFPTAKDHASKLGGGVMSSLHHDQTKWNAKTPEKDLLDILREFKKSVAAVNSDLADAGLKTQIDTLIGKYITNLQSGYSLTML